ncbi:protein kinase domain-containing protein [Ditylenchus destructor]|uniref:Protein kinase domain-containing protein n=1 Tax=Ditylenchus destructor TaxID=166010 RepID=A0AAD4R209_9BILA|nr:protein kinase domain-containing protein [Ditylenchus destructor]
MAGEDGGDGAHEDGNNKNAPRQPPQQQRQPHVTVVDDRGGGGSDSEGDAAEEILEESPDKRWSKRREKVKQRDVPGIDAAYLAMDNETGNEVVWNEVQFSERKNFREQEEKLKAVFDNLTHLIHVNLVKFHKYWTDTKSDKPRIIFITEYMSSGSMSRFLQRARSSGSLLNIKNWKKWVTQILSALNYLHSCDPPIVHANLSCNTVFIQQNGLIKIGCVAPNAIHHHVKTFRENIKNMHYLPPEFEQATTQADIYSFGICALEMAKTGALVEPSVCNGGAGEGGSAPSMSTCPTQVTPEAIRKAVESIEDPQQRDFIEKCLNPDPKNRPTARELLFHPVLFEVHSLKLIASHAIVDSDLMDQLNEDDLRVQEGQGSRVMASTRHREITYAELPTFKMDLEKFLEDVKNGIYPLIAFAHMAHLPNSKFNTSPSMTTIMSADMRNPNGYHAERATHDDIMHHIHPLTSGHGEEPEFSLSQRSSSANLGTDSSGVSGGAATGLGAQQQIKDGYLAVTEKDEGYGTAHSMPAMGHNETRHILQMHASMEGNSLQVLLRLDDQMNRQLTTDIGDDDTAENLVEELVHHGFICESDSTRMCSMLVDVLNSSRHNDPDESQRHKISSPS